MAEAETLSSADLARLERLLTWHEGVAQRDGRLALSLEAEGLDEAARRNRVRAEAHRETALFLARLRTAPAPSAGTFRGHLTPKLPARIRVPS